MKQFLPSADTGDWPDAVTAIAILLDEVPPLNVKVTRMTPDFSEPV